MMNSLYMKVRELLKKSKKLNKKIRRVFRLNIKTVSKKLGDTCEFEGVAKWEDILFYVESFDGEKAIYFLDDESLQRVATGKTVFVSYSEVHYELKNLDTNVIWSEMQTRGFIADEKGYILTLLSGMQAKEIRGF